MAGMLLGEHRRIVEELLSRLRALQRGDRGAPRVVLLRAGAGEGKTRIIREVYARLRMAAPASASSSAASSSSQQYWPELAGAEPPGVPAALAEPPAVPAALAEPGEHAAGSPSPTGQSPDPITTRKEVAPYPAEFERTIGAVPQFGWWVFDCESLSSGASRSAVSAAHPQWEAHGAPLALARNQAVGEIAAKAKPGEPAAELAAASAAEPTAAPSAAAPYAAVFAAWGEHEAGAGGEQLPESLAEQGIALGRTLRSLAHPQLPGVIIIEDMQLMGEELAALVDEVGISDPDRPVLIIGTVTSESARHPAFIEWLAHSGAGVQVIDVAQLPAPDLIALLREHAPGTDDATAMRVVARLGGPLHLELWLTSAAVRRHIAAHDGVIVLADHLGLADHSELEASETAAAGDREGGVLLPERGADVLRERWSELPAAVRAVLACAVFAHPRRAAGVAPFAVDVLTDVCDEFLGHVFTPAQLRDAWASSVAPNGWCRLEEGVQCFKDGLLAQTVYAAAVFELRSLGLHRAVLRSVTRARIARWIDDTHDEYTLPDTDEASLIARWNVAFAETLVPGPPAKPAPPAPLGRLHPAALWRIACDAAARFNYDEAVDRARQAVTELQRVLGKDHPAEYLRNQRELQQQQVQQHAPRTLDDQPRVAPEWAMRLVIAGWLGELGQQSEAIHALRDLLTEMERHAGTRHLATLTVRRDLAIELRDAGVTDEAIGQFRTVIADLTTVVGAGATETLDARTGLAEALGLSGQYDAAVAELRALLPAFMEAYGETNANTFLVRGALAAFLSQSGQPHAAAEQTRMLLEDQELALGASDPQVFTTRNNLAVMLLDGGDAEQAAGQFAQLARERAEALGETNPDTLDTRMNLGLALLEAGRANDAVREFRETLALMQRTLPPGHPSVLRGRAQLAEALGRSGDARAAAVVLRALERDMARRLGARAADIAQIAAAARYWERGAP
ncbi:tetratricopeptide repeat protein [Leucobacter sp. HY1908]